MVGVFNDIPSAAEKFGGSAPSLNRCSMFNNMMNACGLMDLGFQGPLFTWSNKRKGLAKVQERLDRVLANSQWRMLFPEGEALTEYSLGPLSNIASA